MPGRYAPHGRGRALNARSILLLCGILLAAVIGGSLLMQADESVVEHSEEALEQEKAELSEEVLIGGVPCVPKKNLYSFLFMGIDNTASQGENYVTGGQCDTLILLVVDHTHMTYRRLPINRDTMCEVHSYSMDWKDLGTSVCQIALAHSAGDGGSRSCENAVRAVSDFLYGAEIDNYIALNMEAIPVINQLAGGVTVTIEDDFSKYDPSLEMGATIKLDDKQANHYLRGRMKVGSGTNEERMRRQNTYLDAMRGEIVARVKTNPGFASDIYEALKPYMVTNLDGRAFSRLVNALTDCEPLETLSISGTVGVDSYGFSAFEADEESVQDAAIELFYRREDDSEG